MEPVVAIVTLFLVVAAVAVENSFTARINNRATEDRRLFPRWFSRLIAPALYLFKKSKQAWARDRLAVTGVGSAVVAFLLWAAPLYPGIGVRTLQCGYPSNGDSVSTINLLVLYLKSQCPEISGPWLVFVSREWFSTERLPAVAAFLALAFILLLLRRR